MNEGKWVSQVLMLEWHKKDEKKNGRREEIDK